MKTEDLVGKRILVRSGTSALHEMFVFEFSTSKKHARIGKADGSICWMDFEDDTFDKYYKFVEILPETSKKPNTTEPANGKEKK